MIPLKACHLPGLSLAGAATGRSEYHLFDRLLNHFRQSDRGEILSLLSNNENKRAD
jgi:hypothetical protein